MTLIVVLAHFLGAIVSVGLLALIVLLIGTLDQKRNDRRTREELAIALGVSMDELDSEALESQIIRVLAERYSSELFRNRFSDLCGTIRNVWAWFGALLQVLILVSVGWLVLAREAGFAVYAWSIVAVMLLWWVCEVTFTLLCRFATGRYPGQAKAVRRTLAHRRTCVAGNRSHA